MAEINGFENMEEILSFLQHVAKAESQLSFIYKELADYLKRIIFYTCSNISTEFFHFFGY